MSRIDPRLVALARTPLRTASLNSLLAVRQTVAAQPAEGQAPACAIEPAAAQPAPAVEISAPAPVGAVAAAAADQPVQAPQSATAAAPDLPPLRAGHAVEAALEDAEVVEPAPQDVEGVPPPVAEDEPDLVLTAEGEAAQDDDADRRNNGRKTQMIAAAVSWRGLKQQPISGVVKDMSMTGVRLQMPPKKFGIIGSVGDIPDHFILILKNDQIQYDCEVAWRNGNQLGAKFLGRAHPIAAEFKSKRDH